MEESRFLQDLWTGISLDAQSKITEVRNPDDALFFGKCPSRGNKFTESFPNNERERRQIARITEGIERAVSERRTVFLTYYSLQGEKEIPVSMFIECGESGVQLYAMAVNADDMLRVQEAPATTRTKNPNLHQTFFEYLPVGLEIYDADGRMVEINSQELYAMGIPNKEDVLGLNLFENPNFPADACQELMAGEDVRFISDYDFSKAVEAGYYPTTQLGNRLLSVSITIIRDSAGRIENYLLISQDITEDICREEELRQSKRKIEVATKDADIVLWEFDVCKQLFYSENDQLTEYDNHRATTIVECLSFFYAEDRVAVAEKIQRMIEGEDFSFTLDVRLTFPGSNELQYCTFNGTTYECDANGKVTRFVGSRKNNTELQRRKVLQDNILNNIPIPIYIKDLENNSCYVFCNEESTRMFGTRIGGSIYDVMDEAQVVRIEKTDREVFSTGKPYFGVERVELRNGQSYDVLVRKCVIYNGSKRLLLNVRWDQSLQNDLQRRAKVLSLSMQAMNAYTWFYDPEEDRVSFGEGFERTGRNAQLLNTRETFASFIHPEDRQLFIDTQVEQLEKDNGEWVVEYRIDLEGTGNYEWWETRGIIETTMINDMPHKFMLGMSVSIDSHKKTELELREAKIQAEQSDKLKSAFLANMSHEIRTPLNAIIGFSDLLMNTDELEDREDREDYMRIINNNNELLLKLIGDILDLSKIESGAIELKYEEFDLSSYFDDMSTSMKQRATKPGVELRDLNPYEKCIVRLDRSRIAQIMTNYVTNAIKYTPDGFIEMGYEAVDKGIRFYVKDTGIGIADEKKSKVFHRFEKLDEFAQGTGLGLSICKAIAESMGGRVGFESTYNQGSLFWAILPCEPRIN